MTTGNQDDLFGDAPVTAVSPPLPWLEKFLMEAKCWMTARDIMETTKGRVLDRDIREFASGNYNILSGQRGYKHVAHATAAEIDQSANWLISQGKAMIKRGIGQRRNAHKIFG